MKREQISQECIEAATSSVTHHVIHVHTCGTHLPRSSSPLVLMLQNKTASPRLGFTDGPLRAHSEKPAASASASVMGGGKFGKTVSPPLSTSAR